MFICESSARAPEVITFPQVATRKSPLETRTLCDASEKLPPWISRPIRPHLAVEHHDCPNGDPPVGSACRTRGGKTAAKYHTPRFVLVLALREEPEIPVPADRLPGRTWKQGPALAVVPRTERPVRIGYARTSTDRGTWRAGSKPSAGRSATRSSPSRSARASRSGPSWRKRSRRPASSRRPRPRPRSSSPSTSSSASRATPPS